MHYRANVFRLTASLEDDVLLFATTIRILVESLKSRVLEKKRLGGKPPRFWEP